MPTINTASFSGSENPSNPTINSPKSPFPYSPDSYCLPKSITSPLNPESPLLPTNSPTFLVSKSDSKPVFKVPTSPVRKDTSEGINSYVEWVEGQAMDEEDENEGLIMFPTYHDSSAPQKMAPCVEDLELLDEELTEDSYTDSSDFSSNEESDSNASSRSSSPSLEGEEFDCDALCETWSNPSCATPPPTTPPFIFAEDDISISLHTVQPSHCVDYLAREWKTDDLWASYKHVHSHRDNIRASKRLENALWRVWWREQRGLERVDPEVIHWLKDSDINWLYGPFQPAAKTSLLSSPPPIPQTQPQSAIAQNTSPTKSLLKKQDPAKKMAESSQYSFSLLREAIGFRVPSPVPEPQSKFLSLEIDGLRMKEKKGRRVVFNEVVILYREVVEEGPGEEGQYFRGFDGGFEEDFGGVD